MEEKFDYLIFSPYICGSIDSEENYKSSEEIESLVKKHGSLYGRDSLGETICNQKEFAKIDGKYVVSCAYVFNPEGEPLYCLSGVLNFSLGAKEWNDNIEIIKTNSIPREWNII